MIRRIFGFTIVLSALVLLFLAGILAFTSGSAAAQTTGTAPAAANMIQKPDRPNGVWADIAAFPTVSVSPTPGTYPLRLKRAAAAAYPPNGNIYVLGGRHGIDGEDVALQWIWEYNPAGNSWTRKNALLDGAAVGSRYTANMAAAVLTDANGVRIYAIGGSSIDSIPTPVVRVYDPVADVATVAISDTWPAAPVRVPGGYAVVNNKLYIFGGYSSIANAGAGGVFTDTWRFDPLAAAGSRWTQLPTANLNLGRGYIAGVALDGFIYAVGGDIWDPVGRTLVPVTNVERMDPSQANPTWTSVTSLPTARGDMGGWAYNTGSNYEIAGRLVVAGGTYPTPDTQGYIYNPGTNSWAVFPNLVHATRNYATAQLNGYLYAFGGYNFTNNLPDGANFNQRYDATGPGPSPTQTVTGTPPTATRTNTPGPTNTQTSTVVGTVTSTATATVNPCLLSTYVIATATGATVVPATTFVAGSNCDDCSNPVALPFPFRLYDQTFNSVNAVSNGNLQFNSADTTFTNTCLPVPTFDYAILPHWDDLLLTGASEGIYTLVEGTAPNRIFDIEWRGSYFSGGGTVDIEVRLYENSPTQQFDVIYGTVTQTGTGATIGVQRSTGSAFTQFSCDTGTLSAGLKLTFTLPPCVTPTVGPSNTPTAPPTTTRTATAVASATSAATSTATPSVTPTTCPVQFVDVPSSNTFYAAVRCLACRGIVGGYPCGGPGEPCPGNYFRPNANVTRGQTAKIVSESAGFNNVIPSTQQTFEDVAPGSTFALWVERLSGRGIIGGYPCGGPGEPCVSPTNRPYFRPSNQVTRGQLSKITSGAAGWTETPTGQTFEDVAPGSTFYLYIERMASRGIITGYPCGNPGEPCVGPANRPYFRPNANATRGQMAKIAASAFFPNCSTPAVRR